MEGLHIKRAETPQNALSRGALYTAIQLKNTFSQTITTEVPSSGRSPSKQKPS
jgi:hypothetical protein